MFNIEEKPLSLEETQEYHRKVQPLISRTDLRGIKIDLTQNQKIRWVRARLRKASPDRLPQATKQKCMDLLKTGASINETRSELNIGYQTVSKLRRELKHGNIHPV